MDFKLHLLETITNDFSDDQIVGRGGYGVVYKGVHNGEEIAIKRLHALQGLDDKEFNNEFRNLTKVHHKNIVRLIGYCHESRKNYVQHKGELVFATTMERVLCFEYMQGGSLDKHITDESCDLDWPTCYEIIKGTCEGINHLHSAQEKPIFHLDLKPANILLDKNKVAKIADLGLSKLVASTETHRTETLRGTQGYMPPEYIDIGAISKKFDVFSLGVIIIKIMDGNAGHTRLCEMGAEKFTNHVSEIWKKKLQTNQMDIIRVKTCIEIALRCVAADRNKRPSIMDIVHELEKLEAEINKMSLPSIETKDLIGQRSSDYNVLAVDPTQELRFVFEPRKDISCCVQLTNMTEHFIIFNIKTNQTKYNAQPNKGIMPPCSKCYICVTLRAQEKAPPNMQCHDIFLVQSAIVSENLTSKEATEEFFKKLQEEKLLDVVTLPIVYVALGRFLQ